MEIGITTAKIDLGQKMSRFKCFEVWMWNINFFDSSSTRFSNLLIELHKDKKNARKQKEEIRNVLRRIGIKNGSLVGILFNRENHEILYIGSSGKKLWVNVKNNYVLEEPKLDITSIKFFFD